MQLIRRLFLFITVLLLTLISAQQISFGSSQNVIRRQSAEYFLKLQVDLEQQLPGYIVEYAISVSNTSFATAWTSLNEYQQIHNITVYFNYSLPTNVNIYGVLRTRAQGNVINWRYAYSESIKVGDNLPSDAPCTELWLPTSGVISPPKTPSLQVFFESHSGLVTFQLTAQYLLGGYTWVIDFQPFMNNMTAGQYGLGVTSCENHDSSALTAQPFTELWNCAPAANYSAALNNPAYMSYWPGPSSSWTIEAVTCGSVRYTLSSPFARVSTCQTGTGSPAVSYVDLTSGDVLFYGTLYVTAVRPISVLDESRGYQSYASSIPFQWTYNVTKPTTPVTPVTPVTMTPATITPVNNSTANAVVIAPELLPAIVIPAVIGGVLLTLGIVVGVMARHKSTRGAVKKLFLRNNCSAARDAKKKPAEPANNGNNNALPDLPPPPPEALGPRTVPNQPSNVAAVVADNNPASDPSVADPAPPPLPIPKIAIGEILEMVNRNLDFAAQTAGTESDEEMEASGTLEHSESRDIHRSDSPVQHSPVFEKELISNDLVSPVRHSDRRSTFATPSNSPKLKISRTGNEGLRLSSAVNSAQGSSLRSSSDMSARRDQSDSPKSAVLWNSRNSSLVNSRQNSKKHLPRKDSNVLLSGVSEQLIEVKFNVFGRPLSEVVDKNKQLPILLEELTEGLLKAAASLSQLELRQVLVKCFDRLDVEVRGVKRDISLCDFDQLSANIPVALTLLVEYFADLPSALVPLATLTDMLEAMKLDAVPDFQFELQRSAVLSLPHSHFKVLARMSEFIHRLTALLTERDTRQLVFSKTCYRFGLCFMQHASCLKSSAVIDGNEKIAKQVASTCHVFEYIVTHRERLFNLQLTSEQTFTQKDEALYLDTISRDALFKLMINPHYKEPDFLEVLAFGAGYVLSATNWFTQLIECYNALGDTIAAYQVPIKLRILNIFEAWLKLNKRELVSEREAVKVLCKFLQHETNSSPHVQVLVSSLNVLMLTQTKVVPLPSSSVPLLVPNIREDFSIYNFSTKEVARELCLIDWNLFKEVDPTECSHKRFMEARTGGYFFKAAERFNNINAWVQYEILRLTAVKDRVTFMTFLAEVASECLSMNNFSAALAIFCAFNATPIMRLKDTWQKLSLHSKKQLRQLAYVFSMDSNYKVYRKTLARATPPIVPYLGLYGKYLFSIEENVESLTDDGLVNMDKLYKLYFIVKEIRSYQQIGYDFKSNNDLNKYLLNMVTLTEKEAFEQSLKLEP